MIDNPKPHLETVRDITEQIAKGLRAFHRMEMLHQDLRPDNIMIDRTGTVKIIDFGSTRVAGVVEADPLARDDILGTAQYTAPEYFLGESGTSRSDLFSLGVITYQMLTGKLPYGAQVARTRTKAQQRRLAYAPAREANTEVPAWIDDVLERAVHVDPVQAPRGAVGISARPAPSERELQQFHLQAAARAQSAGVLEGAVAHPWLHRAGVCCSS